MGAPTKFCQQLNLTMNRTLHQKFLQNVCRSLHKTKTWTPQPGERLGADWQIFQKQSFWQKCVKTLDTQEQSLMGQFFVTRSAVELEGLGVSS